jgi:cytochrome c oxidase assembly factor CtaG
MTDILLTGWAWYPSVLIGISLWTGAYLILIGPLRRRNTWGEAPKPWQQIAFHSGTLMLLLALISPLDKLGDEYLFSAHMLQHLFMMFVTPPLWLMGSPAWLINFILPKQLVALATWITRPVAAFFVFTSAMYIWHVPALYNLSQANEGVHIFEHLMYIGASLIGWWPVASQAGSIISKPPAPVSMLYLFLMTIPCTALAAILTFSSQPLYPLYVEAPRIIGLSVLEDQHMGGLLMWLPTHMVLLLALGITFFKWLSGNENRPADRLSPNSPF